MPGPVVNGVRQKGSLGAFSSTEPAQEEPMLSLVSDGSIRLLLLCSGELLMARLRNTSDRDGDPAYQLIRPRVVRPEQGETSDRWCLQPFLSGLTPQHNVVLFKAAVASVLEPDPLLLQAYAVETRQECPVEETPVERLKRAFQEFTDSFEATGSAS